MIHRDTENTEMAKMSIKTGHVVAIAFMLILAGVLLFAGTYFPAQRASRLAEDADRMWNWFLMMTITMGVLGILLAFIGTCLLVDRLKLL